MRRAAKGFALRSLVPKCEEPFGFAQGRLGGTPVVAWKSGWIRATRRPRITRHACLRGDHTFRGFKLLCEIG